MGPWNHSTTLRRLQPPPCLGAAGLARPCRHGSQQRQRDVQKAQTPTKATLCSNDIATAEKIWDTCWQSTHHGLLHATITIPKQQYCIQRQKRCSLSAGGLTVCGKVQLRDLPIALDDVMDQFQAQLADRHPSIVILGTPYSTSNTPTPQQQQHSLTTGAQKTAS